MSDDTGPTVDLTSHDSHVEVVRVVQSTSELQRLWHAAFNSLRSHRGGTELLDTEFAGNDQGDLFDQLAADGHLWSISVDSQAAGFMVLRDGVVELLFIDKQFRRRKLATTLLMAANNEGLLRDAHVLPGDRATKSLYESVGWKARLLTMRDASKDDEQPS